MIKNLNGGEMMDDPEEVLVEREIFEDNMGSVEELGKKNEV